MTKEELKFQRENRVPNKNPEKFADFYKKFVQEKYEIYKKVIKESPTNLGYNRPEEYGTIYNPEYYVEPLDQIMYLSHKYDVIYNGELDTYFLLDENKKCVADLQIHQKDNNLHIIFPWQDPKHKGLMRRFYHYLLSRGFKRLISSNEQSENAFKMWKKMAEDSEFNFYVLTDTDEKLIDNPEELNKYFGDDKEQYTFAIELKNDV